MVFSVYTIFIFLSTQRNFIHRVAIRRIYFTGVCFDLDVSLSGCIYNNSLCNVPKHLAAFEKPKSEKKADLNGRKSKCILKRKGTHYSR